MIEDLSRILPGKFSVAPEDLICYGFDASGLDACPAAVVWPENTPDVVNIMKYAYANNLAVIPRGAGTGMTGGAIPSQSSIILSTERMNRILEIDAENMTVLVEPGVINGRLQKELKRYNLFYPPDPSSLNFCTLGGNVAENAGGPKAVKYGVTGDYVMALEAVLPDGRIINTGVSTAKGVVGYDLTGLLVGSEGTLAVITKIRLRLLPLPQEIITLLVLFKGLEESGHAVKDIMAQGIIPCVLEFMDKETIRAVENYKPIGLPEDTDAMLLIELDGVPAAIMKDAEKIAKICENLGGEVIMAEDETAREKLWEARRSISPALYHLSPSKINEDIVVPRNAIPEMLMRLKRLSKDSGIKIVCFGHAGDGNIHVNIMADKKNTAEYKKAKELIENVFKITLELGGTISGEHGVGLTKKDYISMEISATGLELMRKIKSVFDPKNILNPGKIFS